MRLNHDAPHDFKIVRRSPLLFQIPPDLRDERFRHRHQPLGIIRSERLETGVQEMEQVADDRDVAQPQLMERER
jgi:hypothetical protein